MRKPGSLINAVGIAGVIIAMAGCAATGKVACGANETPSVLDTLYFGTAKPVGVVSPDDWNAFLKNTVTPRFPGGLTAWPAQGQWQGDGGTIVRESSYVLNIVHADDESSERAVREIAQTYKSQFQQEAVLRVRSTTCASF